MLCKDYPTAHPLLLCSDADARLWIGDPSIATTFVRFTDLATGRVLIVPGVLDGTEVYVTPAPDLFEGHTYLVEMVYEGIPIAFAPFELVGTAFTPTTNTYTGVHVMFTVGVDTDGDTYIGNDQWLTI